MDCLFEVQDDVAFIYNFKRPAEWPVVVKIEFFTRLGNLETGTIAAYDYSASRFARDVQPLAQKTIDRSNPSLSFTLVPTAGRGHAAATAPLHRRRVETEKSPASCFCSSAWRPLPFWSSGG